MELREGYKKTEIGVIPEDWEVKKLGEITLSIASGKSNTKSQNGDFPIYGSTGIIGWQPYFDYEGEKNLVARVGANAGTVNKVKGKYCVSDNTLMISYDKISNIDFDFAFYQLKSLKLNTLVFGSGQPLITGGQLKNISIPLPPLPEQKTIAEVLSDTDNLIQTLEKLIAKKRLIKQGAMQKLLTPKDDWEVKKLGEICSPSKKRINPITSQFNYKCVELEHISQETGRLIGYTYSKDLKSQKSLFFKNDVLFGKLRPYLKKFLFAEFDGVCTTEIWVLKKTINVESKWLYYLVQSNKIIEVANQSTGTKMPRAEWKVVGDVDVPLPPLPEQKSIAAILSDMDSEIETLEKKLAKYKQLKQGLMQNLLTGKMRLI